MCFLVLHLEGHPDWPVVLLANRDESYDRPFDLPGPFQGRPDVIAPIDRAAGGTWIGVNVHGVLVAITNRGPHLEHAALRSRGQLVSEALGQRSARGAEAWLRDHLASRAYGGFHLLLVDRHGALVVQHDPSEVPVPPAEADMQVWREGSHVISNLHDLGALRVPAPLVPRKDTDYATWFRAHEALAADREILLPGGHRILKRNDVDRRGTVCSALLALPRDARHAPYFRFAAGPPDRAAFENVALPAAWAAGAS